MSPAPSRQSIGALQSVVASTLFGVLYYYATLLAPLDGAQIYGWRILLTAPVLALGIVYAGQGGEIVALWQRLRRQPWLLPCMLLTSALLAVQLWMFLWAPINGYGLDVSLGYFLLPLTLVLTGRVVFGERISRWQTVACAVAAVGIINELLFAPRLAWPTFVVALGYPLYFTLRRRLGTNSLSGMWFDMMFSLPLALWFVLAPLPAGTSLWPLSALVLGMGLLSALALGCMMAASQRLSLGLFGLLSYVEPALLVVVALLLGERIAANQWLSYLSIWAAILILVIEGVLRLRGNRQRSATA